MSNTQQPSSAARPRLSIVIPMEDHRGMLLKAIRSWHEESPLGQPCEVVVVSSGSDPALDDQARSLLGPGDQLLIVPGANIPASYNAGAAAARGDLLLLTEAHCVARPGCAENLIQFFDSEPFDAACLQSDCFAGRRFAEAEQRLFDQAFLNRSAADNWNKVTIRGFGIRRATLLQHGALKPRYELFAQLDLGIRLHAAGVPMGYARTAAVRHFNTDKPHELFHNLRNYGHGEILFRATQPDELVHQYLGPCSEWDRRESFRSQSAQERCVGLLRSAADALKNRRVAEAWNSFKAVSKLLPFCALGPRWLTIKARIELWLAKRLCDVTPGRGPRYVRAYGRYWGKTLRFARHEATAQWLRENPSANHVNRDQCCENGVNHSALRRAA